MEGDTILSEGIAILLFRTIVEMQLGDFNGMIVVSGFLYFLRFTTITLSIGGILGFGSSLLFKYFHEKSSHLHLGEVTLFICVPILAYMWAEGLHVSSSICIRICGILMSRFTQYNLNSVTYPLFVESSSLTRRASL